MKKYSDYIKKLCPKDGDLLVFSVKEFKDPKRVAELMNRIAPGKRIGFIFVENVHDDIAIKKGFVEWLEAKKRAMGLPEKLPAVAKQ